MGGGISVSCPSGGIFLFFFLFFLIFFRIFQGFSGRKKVEKRNWRCRDADNSLLDSSCWYKACSFTQTENGTARNRFQTPHTHTFSYLPWAGWSQGQFFINNENQGGVFAPLPSPDIIENSLCRFCVISAVHG
jgi:hypothetical protein